MNGWNDCWIDAVIIVGLMEILIVGRMEWWIRWWMNGWMD